MSEKPGRDRRIQKTFALLHEALFSLIREKDYEAIVVKEILDRANVGRSTFYTHFRDKDELLVSGIKDTLRTALASRSIGPGKLLNFAQPVFEQIYRHHGAGAAKMGVKARAVVHQHLQAALVELMADDIRKNLPRGRKSAEDFPADLLVQYVGSTFILVLNWWMEAPQPMPPERISAIFNRLVQPALTAATGA